MPPPFYGVVIMSRPTSIAIFWLVIGLTVSINAQVTDRQPVARVGEQQIYEEDLLPLIGAQLIQLKDQEYELRMRALQNMINQKLLEQEARGMGLSIQQLLAEKVDRNVPPPTAAEVQSYYLAHKDPLGRSLDDVKDQLEKIVGQLKLQQARKEYLEPLQRKAGVSIMLSRPRASVLPDPVRAIGPADAPVTIIEFADFECPYCQQAEAVLKQVRDKYKDKIRVAFRDFPLKPIHPLAVPAAEASRCAAEQGKYWEYHDQLFSKDASLDPGGLRNHAQAAGLDVQDFTTCLDSRKFEADVENDLLAGYKAGVSGTPTFYINGLQLTGSQAAPALEKIIDEELASSGVHHHNEPPPTGH
jgi:protein-disulfide isomerase